MELSDVMTSRVVMGVTKGIELLEDMAKRGSYTSQSDFQQLLQNSARLKILCHDFHNNRNGVSRKQHNAQVIRQLQ